MTNYHDRLPYGERVSVEPMLADPFFPFEGDIRVLPLDRPVIPEPPRRGEPGGEPCHTCANPDHPGLIWRDDRWQVFAMEPSGLPILAGLVPREHHTLDGLPDELTASLGPLIKRVATAIRRIPGVGRTHFARWGDGSEHFHMWFLPRPLGMMQMRGHMLAAWDDMLPKIPGDEHRTNRRIVATALAEGGGTSRV